MKPYLTWITAAVIGVAVGAAVMGAFYKRTLGSVIPSHIRTLEEGQEHACMLSLAVLTRLEAGDSDRAKSILAREVADYYHQSWEANAPQRAKVVEMIEGTKPKSAVLREELERKSP